MPRLSPLELLDDALKNAAQAADSGTSSLEIAQEFCNDNRALIEPYLIEWAAQRLASQIRKYRAKARRAKHPQLVFAGLLGYSHLPRKVRFDTGEKASVFESTRIEVRYLIGQFRTTESPALEELRRAYALMRPYSKENQAITLGEVLLKEGEKAVQKGLFDAPDLE